MEDVGLERFMSQMQMCFTEFVSILEPDQPHLANDGETKRDVNLRSDKLLKYLGQSQCPGLEWAI